MANCAICKHAHASANVVCGKCRTIAVNVLKHLSPELPELIRETIRSDFRDRDVIEYKTAAVAAEKIVKFTEPVFYFVSGLVAFIVAVVGFFGVKSSFDVNNVVTQVNLTLTQVKSDLNTNREELTKAKLDLAEIQYLKRQAETDFANIDYIKKQYTNLNKDVHKLENELRIGTVYNFLESESTWTTNFNFPVKGAFIVPVCYFENINFIAPINPINDIHGNEVTYTIKKTKPDAPVGVRIVAWGFGEESDSKSIGSEKVPKSN